MTWVARVYEKISEIKKRQLEKRNENRSAKRPLEPGQIVFVKDFSIPNNGRARKFRPRYYKSPQMVIQASDTSVVTMRFADRFISRHHPDDMLLFKEKDDRIFQDLPKEVLKFLGSPITANSLKELAEKDELELIYTDRILPEVEKIKTRSRTKKEEERQEIIDLAVNDNDLDDRFTANESSVHAFNEKTDINNKKQVSFNLGEEVKQQI